jgi:hypothetical protein
VIQPLRDVPSNGPEQRDYVLVPLVQVVQGVDSPALETALNVFMNSLRLSDARYVLLPILSVFTTGTGSSLRVNALVQYIRLD